MGQIYLDDQTSRPEWVTTKTGLFGTDGSFVPPSDATVSGNDVVVAFDKDTVKDAPRVGDGDGHLSPDQEAELYRYYGLDHAGTEQVHAGTERHEAGRARLRKYVVEGDVDVPRR